MGGNLLNSIWQLPEKRLTNDEYLLFKTRIHTELLKVLPDSVKIGVAPAIRNKESHGDLDIICGIDTPINSKKILEDAFDTTVHVNSNVISFPVDGFQVDITFVSKSEFQTTLDFTSWGDAGMMQGRIAHKFGLHHGHIGLSFWIRQSFFDFDSGFMDSDHVMQKVILTRDFSKILPLLGFDYQQWKNGFDTNEEVYDWVARSKYFSPEIFSFENLNHINRVRNKKRAMYAGFVKWLELNSWKYNNHVFQNREYYISDWAAMFPSLNIAIKDNKQRFEMDRAFKHKLNGYRVMELLGISNGKEVGRVMSELHKLHTREDYVNMPQEKIDNLILGFKYYE